MWRLWLTAMVLRSTTADPDRMPSMMPPAPEDDLLRHLVIGDAEEDDISGFGDFFRRGAESGFLGVGKFLGFRRGIGPDGDFVSGAQRIRARGSPCGQVRGILI